MSRFMYLAVSKCTGRTCNARQVIGGDVVASSWYVYIFFISICMFSYIVFLMYVFISFCVNIHENQPESVFFDLF